jgi:hemolysin activation/secretion protein
VTIDGKDRFPMRFYAGYEDTGSRATGLERLFAGINIGNLFDRGHELGYQYTTNARVSGIGIHSAYWRIPLPNRDTLAFFGNYADYDIDSGNTEQGSINWMAHVRYITPLPPWNSLRHGLELGFDFRRADNDLQVGGNTVYDDYIDVAQFAVQYGGRCEDRAGDTSFMFNVYWSPCSDFLTNHQNKEKYQAVRAGSQSEYVYGHASLERLWVLPKDWSLFNRLTAQVSDSRLPPTEQLGLGGYNTVRGFDEREVNSDQGLMATIELRTPRLDLGIVDEAKNIPSFLQFLAFFDYGYARNRGSYPFERRTEDMLSVGAGARLRISDNVHLRVDYGHKLEDVPGSQSKDGRLHIFFMLSY